jgi:hypothetical protein
VRVRFARWYAVLLTGAGLAVAAVGVAIVADGSGAAIPVLASALVLTLFGLLSFGPIPYAEVSPGEVRIPMTRGPHKRLALGHGERVGTDGNRLLLVRAGGDVKRLPVYRSMAHPADWNDLVTSLTTR